MKDSIIEEGEKKMLKMVMKPKKVKSCWTLVDAWVGVNRRELSESDKEQEETDV